MLLASGFSWFHLIAPHGEGAIVEAAPMLMAASLVSLLVCVFAFVARAGLEAAKHRAGVDAYAASGNVTALTIAEYVVGGFKGMMDGMMAPRYTRVFLPIVMGLVFYIFVGNVLGLIPGFLPPTQNFAHNAAMALTVMVVYWAAGLLTSPKEFIHHIIGPALFLAPLFIPLELLTYLVIRPATLTIRLGANMIGDHAVFGAMSSIIPVLLPVPFLMLGMLVSTIQSAVFALLTTIYISMTLPHGDHHDSHH